MTKARILYIGPIPPEVGGRRPGGIATHCWQLATEASKRGYEVFVFDTNMLVAFNKDGCINNIVIPGLNGHVTIPIFRKARKALRAFQYSRWSAKNTKMIRGVLPIRDQVQIMYEASILDSVVQSVHPDLIHVHSLHNSLNVALAILDIRIPIAIEHYEIWPLPPRCVVLRRAQLSLDVASYLICSSEYGYNQISHERLRNEKPIKVIPIPVEANRIPFLDRMEAKRKLGLTKEKVVFFSGVNQPVQKKGLDILLEAFKSDKALLACCTLLLRTNNEGASWARRAMRHCRGIDLHILVAVEWDTIVQCYNAADAFVMPSRSEGFGIVYSEALLAGTPVVGFSWTVETLQALLGMKVGEPFDPSAEDYHSLVRKIKNVLEEPLERDLLRRRAAEALSWDRLFCEYATVYEELLASQQEVEGRTQCH